MTTVLSQIATDSVVLSDKTKVIKLSGKLAANYKPGTLVTETGQNVWTATPGTGSETHYIPGIVEFKKRTTPTFGQVDIDDAYTYGTAINVEIIVGPRDGTLKLACLCQNLGAGFFFGYPLTPTSGGLLALHTKNSGQLVAYITEEGYTSGDTAVKIYLGCGGTSL